MPLTRNRIACERDELPRTSTLYKRRRSTRRWHLDPAELLARGPQHAALVLVEMGHFLVHLWGHERTRKGLVWRILAVPDAFDSGLNNISRARAPFGRTSSLQFTPVHSSLLEFTPVPSGSNWSELPRPVHSTPNGQEEFELE